MKKIMRLLVIGLVLIPGLASAHGPSRQKVVEKITINASPDKVWALVGDFTNLHVWFPPAHSSSMKGDKVRVLTLGKEGGPTITEELKQIDNEKMTLKYKIIDMDTVKTVEYKGEKYDVPAVPVHNYLSILKVAAVDGGTEVTWTGKFYRVYQLNYDNVEPKYPEGLGDEEAVNTVTAVYQAGLNKLKEIVEGK